MSTEDAELRRRIAYRCADTYMEDITIKWLDNAVNDKILGVKKSAYIEQLTIYIINMIQKNEFKLTCENYQAATVFPHVRQIIKGGAGTGKSFSQMNITSRLPGIAYTSSENSATDNYHSDVTRSMIPWTNEWISRQDRRGKKTFHTYFDLMYHDKEFRCRLQELANNPGILDKHKQLYGCNGKRLESNFSEITKKTRELTETMLECNKELILMIIQKEYMRFCNGGARFRLESSEKYFQKYKFPFIQEAMAVLALTEEDIDRLSETKNDICPVPRKRQRTTTTTTVSHIDSRVRSAIEAIVLENKVQAGMSVEMRVANLCELYKMQAHILPSILRGKYIDNVEDYCAHVLKETTAYATNPSWHDDVQNITALDGKKLLQPVHVFLHSWITLSEEDGKTPAYMSFLGDIIYVIIGIIYNTPIFWDMPRVEISSGSDMQSTKVAYDVSTHDMCNSPVVACDPKHSLLFSSYTYRRSIEDPNNPSFKLNEALRLPLEQAVPIDKSAAAAWLYKDVHGSVMDDPSHFGRSLFLQRKHANIRKYNTETHKHGGCDTSIIEYAFVSSNIVLDEMLTPPKAEHIYTTKKDFDDSIKHCVNPCKNDNYLPNVQLPKFYHTYYIKEKEGVLDMEFTRFYIKHGKYQEPQTVRDMENYIISLAIKKIYSYKGRTTGSNSGNVSRQYMREKVNSVFFKDVPMKKLKETKDFIVTEKNKIRTSEFNHKERGVDLCTFYDDTNSTESISLEEKIYTLGKHIRTKEKESELARVKRKNECTEKKEDMSEDDDDEEEEKNPYRYDTEEDNAPYVQQFYIQVPAELIIPKLLLKRYRRDALVCEHFFKEDPPFSRDEGADSRAKNIVSDIIWSPRHDMVTVYLEPDFYNFQIDIEEERRNIKHYYHTHGRKIDKENDTFWAILHNSPAFRKLCESARRSISAIQIHLAYKSERKYKTNTPVWFLKNPEIKETATSQALGITGTLAEIASNNDIGILPIDFLGITFAELICSILEKTIGDVLRLDDVGQIKDDCNNLDPIDIEYIRICMYDNEEHIKEATSNLNKLFRNLRYFPQNIYDKRDIDQVYIKLLEIYCKDAYPVITAYLKTLFFYNIFMTHIKDIISNSSIPMYRPKYKEYALSNKKSRKKIYEERHRINVDDTIDAEASMDEKELYKRQQADNNYTKSLVNKILGACIHFCNWLHNGAPKNIIRSETAYISEEDKAKMIKDWKTKYQLGAIGINLLSKLMSDIPRYTVHKLKNIINNINTELSKSDLQEMKDISTKYVYDIIFKKCSGYNLVDENVTEKKPLQTYTSNSRQLIIVGDSTKGYLEKSYVVSKQEQYLLDTKYKYSSGIEKLGDMYEKCFDKENVKEEMLGSSKGEYMASFDQGTRRYMQEFHPEDYNRGISILKASKNILVALFPSYTLPSSWRDIMSHSYNKKDGYRFAVNGRRNSIYHQKKESKRGFRATIELAHSQGMFRTNFGEHIGLGAERYTRFSQRFGEKCGLTQKYAQDHNRISFSSSTNDDEPEDSGLTAYEKTYIVLGCNPLVSNMSNTVHSVQGQTCTGVTIIDGADIGSLRELLLVGMTRANRSENVKVANPQSIVDNLSIDNRKSIHDRVVLANTRQRISTIMGLQGYNNEENFDDDDEGIIDVMKLNEVRKNSSIVPLSHIR